MATFHATKLRGTLTPYNMGHRMMTSSAFITLARFCSWFKSSQRTGWAKIVPKIFPSSTPHGINFAHNIIASIIFVAFKSKLRCFTLKLIAATHRMQHCLNEANLRKRPVNSLHKGLLNNTHSSTRGCYGCNWQLSVRGIWFCWWSPWQWQGWRDTVKCTSISLIWSLRWRSVVFGKYCDELCCVSSVTTVIIKAEAWFVLWGRW